MNACPKIPARSVVNWYRGDFHVHTSVSGDGATAHPTAVAEMAKDEGLDFLAITDHNTIEALAQVRSSRGVVVIPGMEVTLGTGHFNVFGIEGWQPWMEHLGLSEKDRSMTLGHATGAGLMRRSAEAGLLTSINHPVLAPWAWEEEATDLRFVHCLEVWNDPYWPDNRFANPAAVKLWTRWLDSGLRITAIGGSDYHYPPGLEEGKPGERLGYPSTYVGAGDLSVDAIIDGLRHRRAYVTIGPRVAFHAVVDETVYVIGDEVKIWDGEIELAASVELSTVTAAHARIVSHTGVVAEQPVHRELSGLRWTVGVHPTPAEWYRLEVIGPDGELLAITNPIFFGSQQAPHLQTYGDFKL